jgi:phosphatidylglycerophosphatase A
LGFFLFRLFDIVKPPPISTVEKRLHGGWGIVLDDVLAGVFANVTLRLLLIVAGLL